MSNSFLRYIPKSLIVIVVPIFVLLSNPYKALSAERVVLRYGTHSMPITVNELVVFAETGKQSSALKTYFRMSEQNPGLLRNALNKDFPVNGVSLSKTLNSPLSFLILNPLTNVITTPTERGSRESLRGALVTSALDNENQLNLIQVIKNYPTHEVHIHGDRMVETYNNMQGMMEAMPFFSPPE